MTLLEVLVAGGAGFAAGLINALAGGGTLVSFPALLALGVPAVQANVTNTVALVPGYLGGAYAQRRDLLSYMSELKAMVVVSAVGGLAGSILLVNSPERLFRTMVPFLILAACILLGFQEPLKAVLARRRLERGGQVEPGRVALLAPVLPAAVYGGYFGAGLGIMLLAILGMALDDPLPRVNALKSMLSLVINLVAATFFAFSGRVDWAFAGVMAVTSLAGGSFGGRIAGRLKPSVMRTLVIAFGVLVAIRFWIA